jgi:uncharacterized protein
MSNKEKMFKKIKSSEDMIKGYGVASIAVFGSFVNGRPGKNSDIDLLVEFNEPTFKNYFGLKESLQKVLGRKVDVLCRDAVKPAVKKSILKEAEWVIR